MYDTGKVLTGIIVFLAIVTFPIWGNLVFGSGVTSPQIEKPQEKRCVEDKIYMRSYHMDILNKWRDQVVRKGIRFADTSIGKTEMSLTRTCMRCHASKVKFCDSCHNFVGVSEPYCWKCHVQPREVTTQTGEAR